MKVTKEQQSFTPIYVTFETKRELEDFIEILLYAQQSNFSRYQATGENIHNKIKKIQKEEK